ncbi:Methylthioribose-1-phosphate isomerase 2 [Phytophthora nicotianae]|uniref:Methylthioribose-1-phosphate isomerase 2 n=1 Tax=Phytophthora nicotianae TaxID=4792 RepID=A0A0W8DSM5_PHYNI|nr:Methylthioribose-1-phosphate isomerase 2 [Phytophthora nicotianae]
MSGSWDADYQRSVENTVDAIWNQWQDNAEKTPLSGVDSGSNEWRFGIGYNVVLDADDDVNGIFLTGVPSVPSSATPETTETESDVTSRRRSSVFTDSAGLEAPEEEDNNDEEDKLSNFGFSAARLQAKVQTPGMKRRKRLTDLHHFVETQLQKRLFRSWDTIEIAFTGSGEMTVNQIVKFLQLSDVQLGDKDAAKVQKILEDHVTAMQAAQKANEEGDEEDHFIRGRTKSKAVLSFEGFRQIFHPVDLQEASRWKREFDREKFRQRQEKDIYTRELEALEEKGVVMRHTTIKNPFEGLWVQKDQHAQHNLLQQSAHRGSVDELALSDRQFAYFLQVRACEVLMIMERAHLFAIRAYKIEDTLPPALGSMRIIMAIARWMLNALSHGLVQRTEREEEGKKILLSGQEKYTVGEKLLSDGSSTMQIVDGFRDSAGQLDAAVLGVKKIIELKEMMTQAQQQMVQGERLRDEGQHEIMRSQRFLPHLPATKRMISAIRKMYKVVQTKDEIDHMNPELRSILLLNGKSPSASAPPLKKSGGAEAVGLLPLQ